MVLNMPIVLKSTDQAASKAVNIGRKPWSPYHHYGNPFSHSRESTAIVIVKTRDEAIDNFRKWLMGYDFLNLEQVRRRWILTTLPELKGKDLACPGNCTPNRCHGDVLLELANK
jgi:uncharacterized protein DUF4326